MTTALEANRGRAGTDPDRQRSSSGNKIRVLVVDDSSVIRSIISQALGSDPVFDVVGMAGDGTEAVQKVAELQPDVVTLDVEMPRLDGIGALRLIRASHPKMKVVMLSSLTERGAATTIDALMEGANDYVTKPQGHNSAYGQVRAGALGKELADKIKQLFSRPELDSRGHNHGPKERGREPLARMTGQAVPQMLAIGVSTGGPSALAEIMPMLPADFPLPVAIVQHMPPGFTTLLAARLNQIGRIEVLEGRDGMRMEPGRAILAPGDYHMRVVQEAGKAVVRLNREEQENSCRPAVDVLFRSVAEMYGARCVGLVLTGMGQDGLIGARRLKEGGASVLAQDRASSAVWGMPRAIVEADLADKVLSLREIVPELLRRVEVK